MEPLLYIGLAFALVLIWRSLTRLENNMATKQELEAAVDTLSDTITQEISEVTAELERLNGLIQDQDLQPTIDRLNSLSEAVQNIVTPVSP